MAKEALVYLYLYHTKSKKPENNVRYKAAVQSAVS